MNPLIACLLSAFFIAQSLPAFASYIDRVVAYVNNTAITLSEFKEQRARTPLNVDNASLLNLMINNTLIVLEASKMRLEASSTEELINIYLDLKIRKSVDIKDSQVEEFFKEQREHFKNTDFQSVQKDISHYLAEKELNELLKKHLEELKANADVKVLLVP